MGIRGPFSHWSSIARATSNDSSMRSPTTKKSYALLMTHCTFFFTLWIIHVCAVAPFKSRPRRLNRIGSHAIQLKTFLPTGNCPIYRICCILSHSRRFSSVGFKPSRDTSRHSDSLAWLMFCIVGAWLYFAFLLQASSRRHKVRCNDILYFVATDCTKCYTVNHVVSIYHCHSSWAKKNNVK
jgi:hypothetical protein